MIILTILLLFEGARTPKDLVRPGRPRHLCGRFCHAGVQDEGLPQAKHEVDQGRTTRLGRRPPQVHLSGLRVRRSHHQQGEEGEFNF